MGKCHSKHTRKRAVTVVVIMLVLVLSASISTLSCAGSSSEDSIIICSTSAVGEAGDDWSMNPSISADGRYVAFESAAGNLISDDQGLYEEGMIEIYRKDIETGAIVCCSATDEGPGDLNSEKPSISADGRYVAFESLASNLVPGNKNDSYAIFRKDLETGEIVRCSIDANSEEESELARNASISADGRYVAFEAMFRHDPPIDAELQRMDVYRKDLATGELLLCSSAPDGAPGNGGSALPDISADGRYVAFESLATNLTPEIIASTQQIYRKDLQTGDVACCSLSADDEPLEGGSSDASISSDGRYVAFHSFSLGTETYNVYRKDLKTGAIACCSCNKEGVQGNRGSILSSISATGRYVAFDSDSDNLVPGDRGFNIDVFVKDLDTGDLTLASSASSGEAGNEESRSPSISADGRYLVFQSSATNFMERDNNDTFQIYRKELFLSDI